MTAHPIPSAVPAILQNRIDDLHSRLDQAKWPRRAAGAEVPGFDTERLRSLADHWRHRFDWRTVEAQLEQLGQQLNTTTDGRRLHSIHARGGDRVPLLLIHGWPDSPLRFVHLVPLLTAAGHDVVAPAIPGFGLSEEPDNAMCTDLAAEDFHILMTGLGYDRYAVHGGDWGSVIGAALTRLHPEAVVALHLTDVPFDLAYTIDESTASEEEIAYLRNLGEYASGQLYLTANSTQPDVVALAITDSPIGLLGWLAYLYEQWSESEIATEDLLAAASLMWLTDSVRSSMRLYSEPAGTGDESTWEAGDPSHSKDTGAAEQYADRAEASPLEDAEASGSWGLARLETPTAFALFPKDIGMPPRALADRLFRVERFTAMPEGGHFAALEQPVLLAEDLIAFLRGKA